MVFIIYFNYTWRCTIGLNTVLSAKDKSTLNAGQTVIKRFLESERSSFKFNLSNIKHLNTHNILWEYLRSLYTSKGAVKDNSKFNAVDLIVGNWHFCQEQDDKALTVTATNKVAGIVAIRNLYNKQGKQGKTSTITLI